MGPLKSKKESHEVRTKGLSIEVDGVLTNEWDEDVGDEPSDKDVMIGAYLEKRAGEDTSDLSWSQLVHLLRGYGVDFQIFDI